MLHRQLRPWQCPTRISLLSRPVQFHRFYPRCYSSQKATVDARTSGAILFRDTASATTKQLLDSITPISIRKHALCKDYGAVLLFTPCFASRIAYESTFLPAIVNRLCEELTPFPEFEFTISTTVAVVDRIPPPSQSWNPNNVESAHHRSRRPPVGDTGAEGMAYVVARPSDAGFGVGNTALDDGERAIKFITFNISTATHPRDMQVQVPLANTIFQAGCDSILSNIEWKKPIGSTILVKHITKQLTRAQIPLMFPAGSHGRIKSISMPLLPLTMPRRITAAMGNVVRRISGARDGDPVAPASEELERAVHAYFAARGLPPSAVAVWALIRHPKSSERSRFGIEPAAATPVPLSTWTCDPPAWDGRFYDFLIQGARLHRVLSGGGGWGNKAGLISLDPDSHFSGAQSSVGEVWQGRASERPESDGFPVEMLGTAAQVGDYIQFFIARTEGGESQLPHERIGAMTLDFGTIPSTIDEMPMQPAELHGEDRGEMNDAAAVESYPDHFGALSEKGISLELPYQERHPRGFVKWNKSKLDVPYSRLSYYSLPEPMDTRGTEGSRHDGSGETKPQAEHDSFHIEPSTKPELVQEHFRYIPQRSERGSSEPESLATPRSPSGVRSLHTSARRGNVFAVGPKRAYSTGTVRPQSELLGQSSDAPIPIYKTVPKAVQSAKLTRTGSNDNFSTARVLVNNPQLEEAGGNPDTPHIHSPVQVPQRARMLQLDDAEERVVVVEGSNKVKSKKSKSKNVKSEKAKVRRIISEKMTLEEMKDQPTLREYRTRKDKQQSVKATSDGAVKQLEELKHVNTVSGEVRQDIVEQKARKAKREAQSHPYRKQMLKPQETGVRKYIPKAQEVTVRKYIDPNQRLILRKHLSKGPSSTDLNQAQNIGSDPDITAAGSSSPASSVESARLRLGGRLRSSMHDELKIRYHTVHPIREKIYKFDLPSPLVRTIAPNPRLVFHIFAKSAGNTDRASNPQNPPIEPRRRFRRLNIRRGQLLPKRPQFLHTNRRRPKTDSPLARGDLQHVQPDQLQHDIAASSNRLVEKSKRDGRRPFVSITPRVRIIPTDKDLGTFRKVETTSHDINNPEEQERRAAKVVLRIRKFESEWWENPVKYAWDLMERKRLRDERKKLEIKGPHEEAKARSLEPSQPPKGRTDNLEQKSVEIGGLGQRRTPQALPSKAPKAVRTEPPKALSTKPQSIPATSNDALSLPKLQEPSRYVGGAGWSKFSEALLYEPHEKPIAHKDALPQLEPSGADGAKDALSGLEAGLIQTFGKKGGRKRSRRSYPALVEEHAAPRRASSALPDFAASLPGIATLPLEPAGKYDDALAGSKVTLDGKGKSQGGRKKRTKNMKMPGRRGVDSKAVELAEEVRALLKGF